jgi:hypothetical protein
MDESSAWIRTFTEICSIGVIVIGAALRVEHRITLLEEHLSDVFRRLEWLENQVDKLWGRK